MGRTYRRISTPSSVTNDFVLFSSLRKFVAVTFHVICVCPPHNVGRDFVCVCICMYVCMYKCVRMSLCVCAVALNKVKLRILNDV